MTILEDNLNFESIQTKQNKIGQVVKPVFGKVRCFLTLSLLLCLSRLNKGSYILIDLCTLAFMRKISWSELHYITGLSGKEIQKKLCVREILL